MAIAYFQLLKQGFLDLRNNLLLFLPHLLSIGFLAVFALIVWLEILPFTIANPELLANPELIFENSGLLFAAVALITIDVIILYSIMVYIQGMLVGMFGDVTAKGKTSIKDMFFFGKYFFRKLFFTYLYLFGVVITPLAALALLTFVAFPVSGILGGILFVISILFFMFWLFVVSVGFIFLFPILCFEKKSAWGSVKLAFNTFSRNKTTSILTWLIIYIVSFIVQFIFFIPDAALSFLRVFPETAIIPTGIVVLQFALTTIANIASIVVSVALALFVYRCYTAIRRA